MQPRYKGLLIAASVMIVLFLIGGWFGFRTSYEEPRTQVMAFDSTSIVLIEFEDFSDQKNNLQLMRIDGNWERVSERTLEWDPTEHAQALLRQFHFIPVKRDMGMIGLVGDRFKLTNSAMCQISFIQGDGVTHTLNIGSNTFAPGKAGAWTYVNVPDEKIVYAVEGIFTARLRPGSAGI
jgi:hypothetical protein